MAQSKSCIYKLNGKVQHYSWGGTHYIPQLLGIENKENEPYAEYWIGAHPNHSSTISIDGTTTPLNEYIRENTTEVLGQETTQRFGSLPYLFKVLDVKQMLSIQVHPDKESARINFLKENEAGIPIAAPHRNYKDDNHKPELMVALSDFWLLHGFKQKDVLKELLSSIPDFNFLLSIFGQGNYRALYEKVMEMEQQEVNNLLEPVIRRIMPLYENGELLKESEDFWAARAVQTFCKNGRYDKGIFSIYFFNILHLKRGEGIYQPAGLPHAYLEGQNVELMANSDNVLRAGLTDKHIDVPELLKYVRFEETIPVVLGSTDAVKESTFYTAAPEFEISHYNLVENDAITYTTFSAEIILVLSGTVEVACGEEQLTIKKGASVFINAESAIILKAIEKAECFRAAVPAL